jgi:serralysin
MSIFDIVRRIGAQVSDPATADAGGGDRPQVTARALAAPLADDQGSPFENGSATPATTVALPADPTLSGVLWGTRWNTGFITYSDPDSTADYQAGYSTTAGHPNYFSGFSQLSAAQLAAVHTVLNQAQYTQLAGALDLSVEAFTNLGIDYAGAGTGASTIRLANTAQAQVPTARVADFPQNNIHGGDVWFGGSGDNPATGNYDHLTLIHELGHALGLKHGHQAINAFGGGAPVLPGASDSMEYSVMTYRSYVGGPTTGYTNEVWGYAQTFMMYDIRALQQLYGADYTANGGNTVYTWSPTGGETFINGSLALDPGGNRIFMTIWDGNGIDTYDLSNYATNLAIDLEPGGFSVFSDVQRASLGNGNFARGNVFNALQVSGDARSLIENAIGGSGHDRIGGNAAANALSGNAGNDTLDGNGGIDTLQGGSGDDRLDGGLFADFSFGGDGNDTFVIKGSDIADHVDGGAGTDTLDVSGYTNASLGFTINLQAGSYDFTPTAFGPFSVVSVENVLGSARADTVIGSGGANALAGNDGDDLLTGNGGNDTLTGGNGNDTLEGSAGNDVIEGGGGSDTERGGGGNDRFVFNLGFGYPNAIDGGAGTDTFDFRGIGGGFSATGIVIDLVAGYSDIGGTMTLANLETVLGSASAETIRGSTGANLLDAGGGNDTCLGGQGNDQLLGGAGNDFLDGQVGNDVVRGGAGADNLSGGFDADQLVGGAGNDIFAFRTLDGSVPGATDRIIAGDGAIAFQGAGGAAGDRIDVSGIDADLTSAIDDAFQFGLPGTRGHLWCVNSGGNTRVLGNVDNDATIEFQLDILDGGVLASAYVAADFIL